MAQKLLTSKLWAVIYLLIIIVVIIATFKMRTEWWSYFDIFFAFMATFCHFIATLFARIIPAESRRLDLIALGMLGMMVISLVGELIAIFFIS